MSYIENIVNQNKNIYEYGFSGMEKETFDKIISDEKISHNGKLLYLVFSRLTVGYDIKFIKKSKFKQKYSNYLNMSTQTFRKAYKELISAGIITETRLVCKTDIYLRGKMPLYNETTKFKYHIPDLYFDVLLKILDKNTSLYLLSILMFDLSNPRFKVFGLTFEQINFNVGNLLNENNGKYMREKIAYLGLINKKKYYHSKLKGNFSYKFSVNDWKILNVKELIEKINIFPKNKADYTAFEKLQNKEKNKIKAITTEHQFDNHVKLYKIFGKESEKKVIGLEGGKIKIKIENDKNGDFLQTSGLDKFDIDKSSEKPEQASQYNFLMRYSQDPKKYLEDIFLEELVKLNKIEIFENFTKKHIFNFRKNDKYCFDNNIEALRKRAIEIEPKLKVYNVYEMHDILIKVSGLALKSLIVSNYEIKSSLLLYLSNPNNGHFKNALNDYLSVNPIKKREEKKINNEERLNLFKEQEIKEQQRKQEQLENAPRSASQARFNLNNNKNINQPTLAEIKGMENLKNGGVKSISDILNSLKID